ncbi:MAG: restriction endonuclease [Holophagales bacterium]|nr:restriction endonuclease [Holophagales bacterium]
MGTYIDPSDGSPAYPGAWYYLGGELKRSELATFFEERDRSEERTTLYEVPKDLVLTPQLQVEIGDIQSELIRYLGAHPHLLYQLDPNKFEDLVAAIFRDRGYEVLQTPRCRDGGRDLVAIYKEPFGTMMTLVECKRYADHRRIGPGLVRELYGVVEHERASHGILATTTFFTKGARRLELDLRYRLSLRDYNDLVQWCREYGTGKKFRSSETGSEIAKK